MAMSGKTPRTTLAPGIAKVLKRLHYPLDVILLCVRWYVAYPLSLRNLEEMMAVSILFADVVSNPWHIRIFAATTLSRHNLDPFCREIVKSTDVSTFSQRLNQRYWNATATVWKFPPIRVVSPRDHASLLDHCAARGTDSVSP
jgi:hypothetical protein